MSESSLRRKARRMGYVVKKSRRQKDGNNHGGFMLVKPDRNIIVAGERFDLALEDIQEFLANHKQR